MPALYYCLHLKASVCCQINGRLEKRSIAGVACITDAHPGVGYDPCCVLELSLRTLWSFIAYFSRSLHTASGCRIPEIEMMKRQVI